MHAYDVQLTVGAPQPLSEEVALDGFDDCQFTLCATTVAWPHQPAVVDYHTTEGRSWRLRLSADGAQVTRLTSAAAPAPADVSARGTASDLVLFFYGRIPLNALKYEGDRRIFDQLIAWDPSV
ncbi:MDMPI C-terminal domain-containing protein [Micromonospora marina]|uniref:MDMPI C-terminal domain-containing protein n=1 Tax=Micromonospora marina TaxID=307120 RepID=A0A1C5A9R4_9ACTN|nr:MDMPI C-terminal domain-containing protein [Micromonospora marina]